jgi:hypothetical protein
MTPGGRAHPNAASTFYPTEVTSAVGTKLPMRHVGSSVANGGKADEICSG